MVDRQDIDALLVSALYGELTPADEARLAAHLESHPADRAALDDLKTARAAVKQSRIFETQDEPPQAISAMLLQEAHRRAPKPARVRDEGERESWFARLARSFFAHPAMAAAAMLVLVVGVAAVVHNRKGGDEYAGQSAPAAKNETTLDIDQPSQGAAPATPPMEAPTGAAGSATFGVGLAEGKAGSKGELQQEVDGARDKADQGVLAVQREQRVAKPAAHAAKSPPAVFAAEPELQPKDLKTPERAKSMKKGAAEADDSMNRMDNSEAASSRGYAPGMAATAPTPAPAPAAPPPPPQKAPAAPKSSLATGGGGATVGGAPSAGPTTASDARARQLLAQAIEFVKQDNCPEAGRIILQLHDTAPTFYAQNVATNRDLSHCMYTVQKNLDQSEERKKAASRPAAAESVK